KQRHHCVGRCRVTRIGIKSSLRYFTFLWLNRFRQLPEKIGRPFAFRRHLSDASPIGNQPRRGTIDIDAADSDLTHARCDRFRTSSKAETYVGGAVVTYEQHEFHEVANRER